MWWAHFEIEKKTMFRIVVKQICWFLDEVGVFDGQVDAYGDVFFIEPSKKYVVFENVAEV